MYNVVYYSKVSEFYLNQNTCTTNDYIPMHVTAVVLIPLTTHRPLTQMELLIKLPQNFDTFTNDIIAMTLLVKYDVNNSRQGKEECSITEQVKCSSGNKGP